LNTNRLKYYFLNTLLTIALCVAYCLFGSFISTVIGMLIAALLGMVMYREHFGLGFGNAILVLIIFTLFLGPEVAIINGVPLILLGISLCLGTKTKMKLHHMIMLCTVLYLLDILIGLKLTESLTNGEFSFNSYMLATGEQMREVMQLYYPDPEYREMIDQAISMSVDTSIMLAPAVFTLVCVVLSYVLISVYKKMQMAQKTDMSFWVPFNQLQADRLFAVLFLVLFVLLTASKNGMFFSVVANVVLILTFLFLVLGLSVFNYKLKQKGAGNTMRNLLTAALICFSTMFCMIPVFALIICGLTDAFFDYRGLRPDDSQENNNG